MASILVTKENPRQGGKKIRNMKTLTPQKFNSGLVQLPAWFKQPLPEMDKIQAMKEMFRGSGLHTVCESAHCPNLGTCWGAGVATFMILGGTCTRACRFCAVPAGKPDLLDPHEPENVAKT